MPENRVILILGCTASGKSGVARALAPLIDAEIVSMDSMKVYRGMDIGAAKPSAADRAAIPHHLIDVADVWEAFSAARFVELADAAIAAVHARGRPAIVVGGTLLYFKCFYEGLFAGPGADQAFRDALRDRANHISVEALHAELAAVDPEAAARIHRNDYRRIERALEVHALTGRPISDLQREWDRDAVRRPDWRQSLFGLRRPREAANRRINARVREMIRLGLIDEARAIWENPNGVSEPARQGIGYAELFEHFAGKLTQDEATEQIAIHSRQLAKNQRTWLKRLRHVTWFELSDETISTEIAASIAGSA